jgi:hypothetical protein
MISTSHGRYDEVKRLSRIRLRFNRLNSGETRRPVEELSVNCRGNWLATGKTWVLQSSSHELHIADFGQHLKAQRSPVNE